MERESSDVFRYYPRSLLQGQMRIDRLKSAYNLLIIGTTGLQCQVNL